MFGSLAQQFENTWKSYNEKMGKDKEDHFIILNEKDKIKETGKNIGEVNKMAYEENVNTKISIENDIIKSMESLKTSVDAQLDEV